jgi:hypothetical protein
MSFGLEFTNGSNTVIIDSEIARLSVICSGRYTNNTDSGRATTVAFPFTITSTEPPLVFVKPDPNGIAGLYHFISIGSPGAWTGFYFYGQGLVGATVVPPNGEYFVGAFIASPVAQYGFRLWDATSKLIFDSGTPSAIFTRAAQTWTYERSVLDVQGLYWNFYKIFDGLPSLNEFVLVNSFGMKMVAGNASGREVSLFWDFTNNTLRAATVQLSNPFNFWLSAVFAKKVA